MVVGTGAAPVASVVVVAPVGVVVAPAAVVVVAAAAHTGVVIVLVSRVTAPLRASNRPSIVAPVVAVIDVSASTLPIEVRVVPSVAELPTCQNTLHALRAADDDDVAGRRRS